MADNIIAIQSLPGDSSTTTQNIYKNRSHAAQPTDNHSDISSPTIQPGTPEQLGNLPQQDIVSDRK